MGNDVNKEKIKEEVNRIIEDSFKKGEAQYEKAKDTAYRTKEKGEAYVQAHPEKSMAMIFGAGVLFGMMMAGYMKRNKRYHD